MGGLIVTAGGLVFIAATTDGKFRAFDSRTGKELWMTRLDATGDTIPMTYQGRNGKQYVVVSAGSTNRFRIIANTADKTADALIAFSLPDAHQTQPDMHSERTPAPPVERNQTAVVSRRDLSAPGAPLPNGLEKPLVMRVCTKCHGAAVFSTARMSRTAWKSEVASMVEKGATGIDDEMRAVVNYLVKNFGRDSR
jgi:PQQ enzyme repeat